MYDVIKECAPFLKLLIVVIDEVRVCVGGGFGGGRIRSGEYGRTCSLATIKRFMSGIGSGMRMASRWQTVGFIVGIHKSDKWVGMYWFCVMVGSNGK